MPTSLQLLCAMTIACAPESAPEPPRAAAPSESAAPSAAPSRVTADDVEVGFVDVTEASGIEYRNVSGSSEQGYILETISVGAAFLDVDSDGDRDLFFVDGTRLSDPPSSAGNRLYRSELAQGRGSRFEEVTDELGLTHSGWGMGASVGDVDNDGHPDLYVTYWGANRLYCNEGGESFSERGLAAGVDDPGWGSSAAFGDLDNDGLLDLYVANYVQFDLANPPGSWLGCRYKGLSSYCGPQGIPGEADALYRNLGSGRFADVAEATGIAAHQLPGLGVVLSDLDDDGDQDIYVANDSEPNLLFRNDGDFRFRETATASGLAYSEDGRAQAGMGVDAGDFDRDGDFDLFVTNFSDDVNTLYENRGDGTFADVTHEVGLGGVVQPYLGWSTAFVDYDGDGWLDLFVANGHVYPQLTQLPSGQRYGQRNLLYRNLEGHYEETARGAGLAWQAEGVSRAAAVADYDDDGDPDLLFVNLNDRPVLLRNDGGNRNGWIGLQLVGEASNREGIGARVELWAEGRRQLREVRRSYGFQSSHDRRLLFGLGSAVQVDSLVITWPSGARDRAIPAAIDCYWRLREGERDLEPIRNPTVAKTPRATPATVPQAAAAPSLGAAPPAVARPAEPGGPGWSASQFRELGQDLYRQGRYPEAKVALERAITLEPEPLGPYVNLSLVLSGLGELDEAIRLLEEAAGRGADHAGFQHVIGKLYLNQNRLPEALAALGAAQRLSPKSWEYADWLGLALLRADNLTAAESSLRHSTRAAPWSPRPHLHLSRVLLKQGRHQESEREREIFGRLSPLQKRVELYERKVGDHPESPHARQVLGMAYLEQGRLPEALARFRQAVQLDPEFAPGVHATGRVLQARGQLPDAIAAYERACQLDPNLLEAHVDLGSAYHRAHRFDQAVVAYRRALELDPERTLIHGNLGMAHAMAGRFEAAASAFREGLQRDPDSVDLHEALGQVYARQGRMREAVVEWQTVLRLAPDHARAAAAIRQARAAGANP
ncbi:MAG: tetratricopeptide repeat protein [Candidatus Latescibacterota bacterium]|nr:tetratricopeptide repeat protein [Candidatus Latescibacterota bacterium]